MINSLLAIMAFQFINTPYRWGGNGTPNQYGHVGFDCSGLVIKVLEDLKIIPYGHDMTAQGIYNWCKSKPKGRSSLECDSLLFFGESTINGVVRVKHVAISLGMVDGVLMMIEAGGGDRGSESLDTATLLKRNARVRIMPVSNRKDLIGGITFPWKDFMNI